MMSDGSLKTDPKSGSISSSETSSQDQQIGWLASTIAWVLGEVAQV